MKELHSRGLPLQPSKALPRHWPEYLMEAAGARRLSNAAPRTRFYRDTLGLRIAGESENYGTEQEHLSNVFGTRLRITALRSGDRATRDRGRAARLSSSAARMRRRRQI